MSTSVDKGVLTRKLGASDYSPVKYVAEISTRCVGKTSQLIDWLMFIVYIRQKWFFVHHEIAFSHYCYNNI